jgi:predicted Ser/Thr protein kinase
MGHFLEMTTQVNTVLAKGTTGVVWDKSWQCQVTKYRQVNGNYLTGDEFLL